MNSSSQTPPRILHLPPSGRPRWVCPQSAQLDLLYLGWGKRQFAQNPIPVSRHHGWVYSLVCSGNPVLRLATGSFQAQTGQLFIVGPDCASGWSSDANDVTELLTWMWRTPARFDDATPRDDFHHFIVNAALRRELQQIHTFCREEIERLDTWTKLALERARLQMDLAIVRSLQNPGAPSKPALRLELALRWLAVNPTDPNPVKSLCDYLQISPPTLFRLFQSQLHESVSVHHARLRMERAQQLLKNSRASIKEVAYAVGYRHPNDFSRAFKHFTGQSPRQQSRI